MDSSATCFSLSILIFSGFVLPSLVCSIGINYGQIANNLPTPDKVVPLLKSVGATKVKLYDSDGRVLRAFANTGIEFVIGLPNEKLSEIADNQGAADGWVKSNVQSYLPATKITCITAGNEVLTNNNSAWRGCLYPAMQNIHTSLVKLGLDKQVTVTTAHSLAVLETSYPPSSGVFRKDLKNYITPILNFHAKTGSSFLINAYPFFAYMGDAKHVSLDYVLFQPNQGILDPASNLRYDNMLFAQIDAVYNALASMGYKKMPVQVSETGWPSKGDPNEVGATPDNAQKYNGNLMKLVNQNKGTPLRPGTNLDVYVFALFNENMKNGPTSERNYGLFKPDGTPAYQLNLGNITGGSGGGGGGGSGSSSGGSDNTPPQSTSPPYLAISSASDTSLLCVGQAFLIGCLSSVLFLLRN